MWLLRQMGQPNWLITLCILKLNNCLIITVANHKDNRHGYGTHAALTIDCT